METKKSFKIGLDFHVVINTRPSYFKDFTEYAEAAGHQIYVITGGPANAIESFLKAWGIKYTGLFTILDYYAAEGKVTYFPDGHFKIPDELWDTAKAKYCRQHKIDIQIDDSEVYGRAFVTPFCRYNESSHNCQLARNIVVNLALPPRDALIQIEKALDALSR